VARAVAAAAGVVIGATEFLRADAACCADLLEAGGSEGRAVAGEQPYVLVATKVDAATLDARGVRAWAYAVALEAESEPSEELLMGLSGDDMLKVDCWADDAAGRGVCSSP
jgi:hypothetical protein